MSRSGWRELLFLGIKYRPAGQDKLIRHLWKDCLLYRTKNTSKLTINANCVNNTVNHASLAIKRLLWLSVFTTLEPPYWMFSRISEVGPNRKLIRSTPRLSFWTVWFRHNPHPRPTPTTHDLYPRPTTHDPRHLAALEKTKQQTATVISLWFWRLLACPEDHCD